MPAAVAAAFATAVFSGTTFTVAAGLTFGFSWGAFAATLIAGGLSAALAKKGRPDASNIGGGPRTLTIRQPAGPRQVIYGRPRVGGTMAMIYGPDPNRAVHLVVVLAGHECESVDEIWLDDYAVVLDANGWVTNGKFAYSNGNPRARVRVLLGSPDQTADPVLVGSAGSSWSNEHRLRGCCYLYCTFVVGDDGVFANGLPNVSAIVKGRRVYDYRTGVTAWSDNPALCLADYMRASDIGLGAAAEEINVAAIQAAANVCDEAVPLASGGTEKRYTANGAFTLDAVPRKVIEGLLGAMAGRSVNLGGEWFVDAGAYDAPTRTLTESDLSGGYQVRTRLSRRETCNSVKGLFIAPQNRYQPGDFPPVVSDAYIEEDLGEVIWRDLELPWTHSAAMAQRIAKIELLRTRQQISFEGNFKLTAYRARPGRTVALTIAALGWSAKPFEVMASQFSVAGDGMLAIKLTLRETAPNVFDWDASEEQAFDAAPDTLLPDPFVAPEPPGPASVSETTEEFGTGVRTIAVFSWGASPSAYVVRYELQYRLQGESSFTARAPVTGLEDTIKDLVPGVYELQVRALNAFAIASPFVASTVEIRGLAAEPAAVTGFNLVPIAGAAKLTWDRHADADVRIGGEIVIRWTPATSGAVWEDGQPIAVAQGGMTETLAPLVSGTYLVKAKDSSGRHSATAASIATTAPDVLTWNVVSAVDQHPTFPGDKTNTEVVSSKLRLGALPNIDSILDNIDSWTDFDSVGRTDASSGEYLFDFSGADYLDLGAVYTSRVTASLVALGIDNADLWDSRPLTLDEWNDVDGDRVDDATATLWFRTTDDDPAGSPTWSVWRPFVVGEYTCRAYQLKCVLETADLAHNVEVSELVVTVDMPDRVEAQAVTTGTGADTTVTWATPFKVAPKVGITIKNAASGDYEEVVSESAASAAINVRNAGARVARNVNVYAKGY